MLYPTISVNLCLTSLSLDQVLDPKECSILSSGNVLLQLHVYSSLIWMTDKCFSPQTLAIDAWMMGFKCQFVWHSKCNLLLLLGTNVFLHPIGSTWRSSPLGDAQMSNKLLAWNYILLFWIQWLFWECRFAISYNLTVSFPLPFYIVTIWLQEIQTHNYISDTGNLGIAVNPSLTFPTSLEMTNQRPPAVNNRTDALVFSHNKWLCMHINSSNRMWKFTDGGSVL